MKVKVGDIISSDYGTGKIICITNIWVIHETEDKGEVAVPYKIDSVWVPVQETVCGCNSGVNEIDIPRRS